MTELVRYDTVGRVARVTLARPDKLNMLTPAMVGELLELFDVAARDDEIGAIVLRGDGRAFCGGFDLTDLDAFYGSPGDTVRKRLSVIAEKGEWMRAVHRSPKPVVAAVHGPCTGIGTMLVVVSQLALAADTATMGFPEERLGSAGATWVYPFLASTVGLRTATEILMTGRRLDAAESRRLGLVNAVVAAERLDDEAMALADAVSRSALHRNAHAADRSFTYHAPVHALAERVDRTGEPFDFVALASGEGLSAALRRRDEHFAGSWWGWGRTPPADGRPSPESPTNEGTAP